MAEITFVIMAIIICLVLVWGLSKYHPEIIREMVQKEQKQNLSTNNNATYSNKTTNNTSQKSSNTSYKNTGDKDPSIIAVLQFAESLNLKVTTNLPLQYIKKAESLSATFDYVFFDGTKPIFILDYANKEEDKKVLQEKRLIVKNKKLPYARLLANITALDTTNNITLSTFAKALTEQPGSEKTAWETNDRPPQYILDKIKPFID